MKKPLHWFSGTQIFMDLFLTGFAEAYSIFHLQACGKCMITDTGTFVKTQFPVLHFSDIRYKASIAYGKASDMIFPFW